MLGYADDHAVYKNFLPMDESSALEGLTEVIMRIRNWMKHLFLKMYDSKTEIVIFGTHSQCNKITTTAMQVGETPVNISSELNYLGILLDQNLTTKTHMLTKTKRAAYNLYGIRQIAKFLDLPAKKNTHFLLGYVPVGLCQCHLRWPTKQLHTLYAKNTKSRGQAYNEQR